MSALSALQIVRPIPEHTNRVAIVVGRALRVAGIYIVIAVMGAVLTVGIVTLGVRGLLSGALGFVLAVALCALGILELARHVSLFARLLWERSMEIRDEYQDLSRMYGSGVRLERMKDARRLDPEEVRKALDRIRESLAQLEQQHSPHDVAEIEREIDAELATMTGQQPSAKPIEQGDETTLHFRVNSHLENLSWWVAGAVAFCGAAEIAFRFHSPFLGGTFAGLWVGVVALVFLLSFGWVTKRYRD